MVQTRQWTEVNCKNCHKKWLKRKDTISFWQGMCRSCAQKFEKNKSENRARQAILSKEQVLRRGGIPNARHFTSEHCGSKHWNWNGGITPFRVKLWKSKEYKEWRLSVFKRDNYTCQMCRRKGGNLEADHIKSFSLHPELRFELSNGRTLCKGCHRLYGVRVSYGRVTKEAVFSL